MKSGDMRAPVFHSSKRLGFELQLTGPNRGCWIRVNGITEEERYYIDFNRGYLAEQLGVNPLDLVVHLDQMTSAFEAWFREAHPKRAKSDQFRFKWRKVDRLDLQVDGAPLPPGPLPISLKEELERTPNLSANDILHAFETIEAKARLNQLSWESHDMANELMQKLSAMHRPLDPMSEEGYYYVQYTKRDFDDLLRSYRVSPERVITPSVDPDDERSLKALLGEYFVNRLEIFEPSQVINAIHRTTSISVPDKQAAEFVQGPTCFELGDLDVAGFIDLLSRPASITFKYSNVTAPSMVESEVATGTGSTTVMNGPEPSTDQPTGVEQPIPPVPMIDKNLARANGLLLEKLQLRPEDVGISGPTEEQLVWAANEVLDMIGKDAFLSLYAHETRNSRFYKHKPRYLETRTNLNWTQQVETRVSYHNIAELIQRVEAKLHPSAPQKAGTAQVNAAPAAVRPGRRPSLIVDQHVLQYSWFSPAHEEKLRTEVEAQLRRRGRTFVDGEDRKNQIDIAVGHVQMVFQVWFFHELGHNLSSTPGKLSRALKVDAKDERERVMDCVELLIPSLEYWDVVTGLDLFSRNREVSGVKVIRAKPKDKVFTTYKNDLRLSGGNDSPYYRTVNIYLELARMRRQIVADETTIRSEQGMIAKAPKGFDRETLQKDLVTKTVELEKLKGRFIAKVETLVDAALTQSGDQRLMCAA